MIAIGCLSQKGGVGKSTIARLIARTYAAGGWHTKIADFNVKQKTSVDWAALRMSQEIEPEIAAEAYTDVSRAVSHAMDLDLIVFDGKPDADTQTIRIAQQSDLVLIPTGVSADDLVPQVRFAQELQMRGVLVSKIFFILNKVTDSHLAVVDARRFVESAGFTVAKASLPMKTSFINAQNSGRALSECEHPSLNLMAEALAAEVIERVNEMQGVLV